MQRAASYFGSRASGAGARGVDAMLALDRESLNLNLTSFGSRVSREWRRDYPVIMRGWRALWPPPIPVMVLGAGWLALMMTMVAHLLLSGEQKPAAVVAPPKFSSAWTDMMEWMERKPREVEIARGSLPPLPETRVVTTERILPDAATPPPVAPIPQVVNDDPQPRRRETPTRIVGMGRHDICAKHNMRKVITNGGRSWRCQR